MNKGEALSEVIKQAGWLKNLFTFGSTKPVRNVISPGSGVSFYNPVSDLFIDLEPDASNIALAKKVDPIIAKEEYPGLPRFGIPNPDNIRDELIAILKDNQNLTGKYDPTAEVSTDDQDTYFNKHDLAEHYGLNLKNRQWNKFKTYGDIEKYVSENKNKWNPATHYWSFEPPNSEDVSDSLVKLLQRNAGKTLNKDYLNKPIRRDFSLFPALDALERAYDVTVDDKKLARMKRYNDLVKYFATKGKLAVPTRNELPVKQSSAGYKLARLIKLSSLANEPYKVKTKVKPTHKGIQQPQQIGIAAQPQTQNPNQIQSIEQSSQNVQNQQGQQANNYSGVAPLIVNPMMASLGVKKADSLGDLLSSVDDRETLAKLLERIWRLKQVTKLFKAIKYR